MTYNRDLQEDKEAVFDSLDTAELALSVFTEMLEAARVREDRAAGAVSDPMLLATDLADYLVLKGMPFRQAHEVVGRVVAEAVRLKIPLNQMSLEQFRLISPVFEMDVASIFNLQQAMENRRAVGAPSPSNVKQRLKYWEEILKKTC
jgi:argininosuccinate lyase